MMTKIFLTAIREFKATAMTKAFFFGTILLPVIIGGVLYAAGSAGLLTQKAKPIEGAIALVDPTGGSLSQRVQSELKPSAPPPAAPPAAPTASQQAQTGSGEQQGQQSRTNPPNIDVETLAPDTSLEPARERVRSGELLGLAVVTPESLAPDGKLELFVGGKSSAVAIKTIEEALQKAVVDNRLVSAGVNAQEIRSLVKEPSVKTHTLTKTGEAGSSEALLEILPFAGLILMALAIFTGSGYLLMSTVEEKSSRVMEVLLSGMSPMQLMTGKIFGQGLVGLVTLAIYAGLGVFTAKQFKMLSLIPPDLFAWLFIYFIMGYFIFAAINAAMGAAVNEMREAQALQGPVMGVTILMIYLTIFSTMTTHNPHSTLAQILSFFPLATPFVMPVRLGYINDPMPTWQLIGAPIVGFAGMLFSVWFAAKVFRVGVLMYGQPPKLRTVVKWVRYK